MEGKRNRAFHDREAAKKGSNLVCRFFNPCSWLYWLLKWEMMVENSHSHQGSLESSFQTPFWVLSSKSICCLLPFSPFSEHLLQCQPQEQPDFKEFSSPGANHWGDHVTTRFSPPVLFWASLSLLIHLFYSSHREPFPAQGCDEVGQVRPPGVQNWRSRPLLDASAARAGPWVRVPPWTHPHPGSCSAPPQPPCLLTSANSSPPEPAQTLPPLKSSCWSSPVSLTAQQVVIAPSSEFSVDLIYTSLKTLYTLFSSWACLYLC